MFCNVKHPKSGVLSDITPAGERSAVSTHCRYKDNARRVLGTARSDSGFSRKVRKMKTKTKIAAFLAMLMFAHAPAWAFVQIAFSGANGNLAGFDASKAIVAVVINADSLADAQAMAPAACTAAGGESSECRALGPQTMQGCQFLDWRAQPAVGNTPASVGLGWHFVRDRAAADAYIAQLRASDSLPEDQVVLCSNPTLPTRTIILRYSDTMAGGGAGLASAIGSGGGSSSSKSFLKKNGGIILGGAAAVGLAVWAVKSMGGDIPESTSFSPVAEYSNENGTRRWHVGSRYDWQKGDWSAYWKATKTDDSFSFGSGMEWTNDIVAAKFISGGNDGNSDLDFSLSAKRIFGLWTLSPEYRLDYRTSETDKTLLHALSANAVWQGDKWTVRHSLGLSGESFAAFGKNATAKIQLRRDF